MSGRRWAARVALAATCASIGLVATGAVFAPASADVPTKVAWWNFASGGGQSAPAPDAPAGGMRVSVSSQQTLAYGAIEYSLPADGSATLELSVAQTSGANGASINKIEACPTKDDSWKAGDDQDAATAPAYDCTVHHYVGRLSSDAKTVTFFVDGAADVSSGVLSLAIVPEHSTAVPVAGTEPGTGTDLTPPFFIDFNKPSSNSFTQTGGSSSSQVQGPMPAPAPVPASAPTTGGTGSGAAAAPPPSLPAGGAVNVPTGGDTGQTPVVAGQQPSNTGAVAPQAAVRPAPAGNDWRHNLLLLLLIGLGFAFFYMQNQSQRGPRSLLPVRGPGATGPGGADAADAAVAAGYPPAYVAARGLGRFAKPRSGSARPLI